MTLWPMFGAVNQLLAALGLLVVSVYIKRYRGGKAHLVTSIPCVFMLSMTLWAVTLNEINFIHQEKTVLALINAATGVLAVWMAIESALVLVSEKQSSPHNGADNGTPEAS